MPSESINDLMFRKLSARYPSEPKSLSSLLRKFETDNPTWSYSEADKRRDFYGGTEASVADRELRYWTNLVP